LSHAPLALKNVKHQNCFASLARIALCYVFEYS
jgi:hypothetical protein